MRCTTINTIWNVSSIFCAPAKYVQRPLKRHRRFITGLKMSPGTAKTRVESMVLFCFAKYHFMLLALVGFRNFSKFTLLLSNFWGSSFEFVTHKRSWQYLCRKNGKTYFGIVSGFDIWCGLTHKVMNVCPIVTICHLVFFLALTVDIPLRVSTYKLNSRLFLQIRTIVNLASKFYDQSVNPRRIGSDESPCSCCPAKKWGVCIPGTPLLASLQFGIMWVSHSIILCFVYVLCDWSLCGLCILCCFKLHKRVSSWYVSTGLSDPSCHSGLIQSTI